MAKEISDSYVRAIGEITVNFSELELTLLLTIKSFARIHSDVAQRLLGGDSFEALRLKLNKIFIYATDDILLKNEFGRLSKKLEKMNVERNNIVHSYWLQPEGGRINRVKFRKNPSKDTSIFDVIPYTFEELIAFAKKIKDTEKELENFTDRTMEVINGDRRR